MSHDDRPHIDILIHTIDSAGRKSVTHHQCTRHYMIARIKAEIRRMLGHKPRQRVKKQSSGG